MKTLFFSSAFLWLTLSSFAQNFQGIAYYSSQTSMKNFNFTSDDMTPDDVQKLIDKSFNENISIRYGTTTEKIVPRRLKITSIIYKVFILIKD